MRNNRADTTLLSILAGAVLLLSAPAAGDAEPDARRAYAKRQDRARTARRAPQSPAMPDGLRIEASGPDVEYSEKHGKRPAASRTARRPASRLERRAELAAEWSARRLAETTGRREYYRVGFWYGLQSAIDETSLGDRDFAAGRRSGFRSLVARDEGVDLGRSAARERANSAAVARVERQFRDLSTEPRFEPRAAAASFEPRVRLVEPRLHDVFADYPVASFVQLDSSADLFFSGWDYDAWRLYRCDRFGRFYDDDWMRASAGFDFWKSSRRRAEYWFALNRPEARQRFRAAFEHAFAHELARRVSRLGASYDLGFDEGWFYGAFVREEFEYRRGFERGYRDTVARSAERAFRDAYPAVYERAYGAEFRDWSESVRPEIVSMRLYDGDDDGVFEPGEDVRIDYRLVNYGGAGAELPVRVDGRVLERGAASTVRLPARRRIDSPEPLTVRIRPGTPAKTRTRIELDIAGAGYEAPLTVTWPLRFNGRRIDARRDDLAGEVALDVFVGNLSRRPVDATVELIDRASGAQLDMQRIGSVGAGDDVSRVFLAVGLDPLALIAGRVALDLTVRADGIVQDTHSVELGGTARDLANDDLLRFMLRQARDPREPRRRIDAARDLMLQRIRTDWRAAVRSRGNPYKSDLRRGTAGTALGRLVRAYTTERSAIERPDVFSGLEGEIVALSRTLPGAHPFLRKSMRRLAAPLP